MRDRLGFLPGTEVEFVVEDEEVILRKALLDPPGEDWGAGHLEEGDGDSHIGHRVDPTSAPTVRPGPASCGACPPSPPQPPLFGG
jgi:hypothetical protein